MKPLWQYWFIPTVLLLGGLLSVAYAHDLRSVQRLPDGTLGVLTALGIFSTILAIVWFGLALLFVFKRVVQKTFEDVSREKAKHAANPATTSSPDIERR